MPKISKERTGQYLLTAVKIIHDHGGVVLSRILVREMSKVLQLSDYELSFHRTGPVRWATNFRFHAIGLCKGGYIKRENKRWYLTKKGEDILDKEPLEILEISKKSYEDWKERSEAKEGEEKREDVLEEISPIEIIPQNLKITPRAIKFDELIKGVDKSLIQIPPFQRNFVWKVNQIVELLDSIYNGYPIGSFIFWKTQKILPRHREIGGKKLNEIFSGSQIDYVIDGQQRITSLYAAVKCAKIEDDRIRFYFDLTTGKFSYKRIADIEEVEQSQAIVPLDKLFVNHNEYYEYIRSFPEKFSFVLNDLYVKFKDYSFSVIYIQNEDEDKSIESDRGDIEKIVKIFSRINDTGKKLTVVAKMIAKCWEKNFNLRDKLNELIPPNSELEEIREETILQGASVILNDKKCKSKNILEDTNIKELEENWDSIADAVNLSLSFIKDKLRIKNLKYLPFDSLLVPLTYFHYHNHNPSNKQSENLFKWFWLVCLSNHYGSTVDAKIEEDCEKFDKLLKKEDVEFNYLIDWRGMKMNLIKQKYNFRNAFCKTVLSLYSYNKPQSFKDNREIDIASTFSEYHKNNLHHVFPRKYLKETNHPQINLKDSIVNIAFAPAVLNREMSSRAPSNYIAEFSRENNEIQDAFSSHFIADLQDFGLHDDDFEKFLNKRAEVIEKAFHDLVGMRSKIEKELEERPNNPIDFLESKIREVVDEKLSKEEVRYWEKLIPEDIRTSVDRKISYEKRKYPYKYKEEISGKEKLSFLDVMDYQKIILSNWDSFSSVFISRGEVEKHFSSLKDYRNCVKHSRALDEVTKRNGEAAILWLQRVIE